MKIILNIPSEFCRDYLNNSFDNCFHRLLLDTKDRISNHNILMSGNYEIEILEMFITVLKILSFYKKQFQISAVFGFLP